MEIKVERCVAEVTEVRGGAAKHEHNGKYLTTPLKSKCVFLLFLTAQSVSFAACDTIRLCSHYQQPKSSDWTHESGVALIICWKQWCR